MKLSMSLLGKYLEHYHPEYHITEDILSIRGVRFLSDPRHQSSLDYVYLGAAGGYYQDVRYADALLLVNGNNQIICRGADYEELLNDVLSTFEYYNIFERNMHSAAAEHAPLEVMVKEMRKIYHSPIVIFDLEGNLLAASHMARMTDSLFLKNLKEQKRMEMDTLSDTFVDEEGTISHDLSDTPQHLFSSREKIRWGTIDMYLCQEEERIGFIMMFPESEIELMTGLCLEQQFARYCVMAEEFTGKDSVLKPNRSIFLELLAGESVEPAVLRKFEQGMHISTDACLIALENQAIQNYTLYSIMIRDLSSLNNCTLACDYENRIVILTGNSRIETVIRYLKEKMPWGKYAVGISMPFRKMELLPVACRQAFFALKASPEPAVRRCRDLASDYLIQMLRKQDMAMELLHPAINVLKAYDESNRTELLETLKVYIQACCSQIDTASKMNIHLNTLKYRLKRISELGGLDLKDESEMFYVRLSLRLSEII